MDQQDINEQAMEQQGKGQREVNYPEEKAGTKPCCCSSRPASAESDKPVFSNRQTGGANQYSRISGGRFLMGSEDPDSFKEDGEGPVREVIIDSFDMSPCTVTNLEFEQFIRHTGYVTDAERFGWSFVFSGLLPAHISVEKLQVVAATPWWSVMADACWKRPEGEGSNIDWRMDHPAVHISFNDASAYCEWSGQRLPTEAEWEYAARGGLIQQKYPWGNELEPGGKYQCNIWQGVFPARNTMEDGYYGTAPARSYKPNGYGLYNTVGNVWEWCSDWFSTEAGLSGANNNPKGPGGGTAKVIRGGSFLCHASYCNRYRVAARSSNTVDSTASNIGFRCVAK